MQANRHCVYSIILRLDQPAAVYTDQISQDWMGRLDDSSVYGRLVSLQPSSRC